MLHINHKVMLKDGTPIEVSMLKAGDLILGEVGPVKVLGVRRSTVRTLSVSSPDEEDMIVSQNHNIVAFDDDGAFFGLMTLSDIRTEIRGKERRKLRLKRYMREISYGIVTKYKFSLFNDGDAKILANSYSREGMLKVRHDFHMSGFPTKVLKNQSGGTLAYCVKVFSGKNLDATLLQFSARVYATAECVAIMTGGIPYIDSNFIVHGSDDGV